MAPARTVPPVRTHPPSGPDNPPPPPGPKDPRHDDEALTVKQAAKLLNVDVQSVYGWIYAGQLAFVDLRRPGGRRARIRVEVSDLRGFLAARKRVAA